MGRMALSTPPDILATNVRRSIEASLREGDRFSVRAWAMSRGLQVRMIDRLIKGEHAVTLDTLTEIADACGLKPWHLLIEDLDPDHPPDAPISEEERQLLRRLRRLLTDGSS